MPINGFSAGRDIAVNIQTPTGPLELSLVTKFTSKPENTDVKVKGMDGRTRNLRFPNGWSGSFEIERQDSTVDDYFALDEASYYAGVNIQSSTITETITDPDGSVSQYQFVGVMFKLDDAGSWEGDKTVKQKISFVAEQRIKLS
jgi:hypothetical protein